MLANVEGNELPLSESTHGALGHRGRRRQRWFTGIGGLRNDGRVIFGSRLWFINGAARDMCGLNELGWGMERFLRSCIDSSRR